MCLCVYFINNIPNIIKYNVSFSIQGAKFDGFTCQKTSHNSRPILAKFPNFSPKFNLDYKVIT